MVVEAKQPKQNQNILPIKKGCQWPLVAHCNGKTSSRSDEAATATASMLISLAFSGVRRRFLCSPPAGSKGSKPDDSCHRHQEWNPRTNRKALEWSLAA